MQRFKQSWFRWTIPVLALAGVTIWYCDPGVSLNPQQPVVPVAKISYTNNLPRTPLQPGDTTGSLNITITDSATGQPLAGAPLSLSSVEFSLYSSDSAKPFSLNTVPTSGQVSVRIAPRSTNVQGRITISAGSSPGNRTVWDTISISEKPVTPFIESSYPSQIGLKDSAVVTLTIKDSAGNKLQNAVVDLSSSLFALLKVGSTATVAKDTTKADGKIMFRIHSDTVGTGNVKVVVTSAAGLQANATLTISVTNVPVNDRPRAMTFVALRPTLKADGSDSTLLKVVVKDAATNNPLEGENIVFTATGGLVSPNATTDAWGTAYGLLKSERANKSVVVTATMVRTGASAQQTVTFDGINIAVEASKRVIMRDSVVDVVFTLTDANTSPMSGDTLELVAVGAYHGFGQRLTTSPARDSILRQVDTRGQYKTTITSHTSGDVLIDARALGARTIDTITFTNNSLNFAVSKASILGDGKDQSVITATLIDGNNAAIAGAELRWTTTFGTFTTTPFTTTAANGKSSITLRSPNGSGLATINVEAHNNQGAIIASGNITVRVTALPVHRLDFKVSPDNIPIKIGEASLIAHAYDSTDNVMTNVLIGFRLIKGAGGGDEIILPPVSYTDAGLAQSVLKAGGVISLYQGVKLAAVALDISGTDTLVIASSDTVGLTISGPPYRVSVGANILKGINPNDGTFALPVAAVVTDVNGNLVADGTPVNFGVHPVAGHYRTVIFRPSSFSSSWSWFSDTVFQDLPWTDYNNNNKLDVDETPSAFNRANPARGEDKDGDGVIHPSAESFTDINGNGVWDDGLNSQAEPTWSWSYTDTLYCKNTCNYRYYYDINYNGKQDFMEPFKRGLITYTDSNFVRGTTPSCKCTGQNDPVTGQLYEQTYFGSPANRPYPGFVSTGIDRQAATLVGKATTKITYVQTDATYVTVRITAEANGIRSTTDVWLPVIKD